MLTHKPYLISSCCFLLMLVAFQYFAMNVGFEGYQYTHHYAQTDAEQIFSAAASAKPTEGSGAVCLVGQETDSAFRNAIWMLERLKLPYTTARDLNDEASIQGTQTLLIAASVGALENEALLYSYLQAGGQAIFLRLPGGIERTDWLLEMLGLLRVEGDVTYDQFEVYDGLLLGGMVRYQEAPVAAKHIRVNSVCKVLACMWEGDPDHREDEVPLIYEKRVGKGVVHVVNAPFFEDPSSIGILTSLLSIPREAFVYPVVNSMTVTLRNYPMLTADESLLRSVYARDAYQTCRDVLWLGLSSMLSENNLRATAFLPPMDLEGRESELAFFMRALSDHHSELGLTAPMAVPPSVHAAYPDYDFYTAWGDAVGSDTRCVVRELNVEEDGAAYRESPALYPLLTKGFIYNESENFRLRGFATGMYMVHHGVDMALPLLLEEPEHAWQQMAREMASTLHDSTKPFLEMRRQSASEGSLDMMTYEAVQPSVTITEQGLTLRSGLEEVEACFLLRTRHEIGDAEGLRVEKLQEGAYLLTLEDTQGSLSWKESPTA